MTVQTLQQRLAEILESGRVTDADVEEIVFATNLYRTELLPRFHSIVGDTLNTANDLERKSNFELLARLLDAEQRYRPPANGLLLTFSLAADERARVAELCSAMRKIIHGSVEFDSSHKIRLLKRIGAIEVEVHKQEGLFDVLRAGLTDLGETLGQFGNDVKPLTDRMAEVVGIAKRATKGLDQLAAPEDVKKLPPPDAE